MQHRTLPIEYTTPVQASASNPTVSGELEFTADVASHFGYIGIRTARNDDVARYNSQVAALMFVGAHAAEDMRAAAAVLIAEADALDETKRLAANPATDTPEEA